MKTIFTLIFCFIVSAVYAENCTHPGCNSGATYSVTFTVLLGGTMPRPQSGFSCDFHLTSSNWGDGWPFTNFKSTPLSPPIDPGGGSEEKTSCPQCGIEFPSSYNHFCIISPERPFSCKICGKYYPTGGSHSCTQNPNIGGGLQGEKGDKGDTGAQGPKGDKGDKGDTGAQGAKGEQGEKGDKGDKGDTGAQGVQGATGARGLTGAKGDQGIQGVPGIQGERGEQARDYTDDFNKLESDHVKVFNSLEALNISNYNEHLKTQGFVVKANENIVNTNENLKDFYDDYKNSNFGTLENLNQLKKDIYSVSESSKLSLEKMVVLGASLVEVEKRLNVIHDNEQTEFSNLKNSADEQIKNLIELKEHTLEVLSRSEASVEQIKQLIRILESLDQRISDAIKENRELHQKTQSDISDLKSNISNNQIKLETDLSSLKSSSNEISNSIDGVNLTLETLKGETQASKDILVQILTTSGEILTTNQEQLKSDGLTREQIEQGFRVIYDLNAEKLPEIVQVMQDNKNESQKIEENTKQSNEKLEDLKTKSDEQTEQLKALNDQLELGVSLNSDVSINANISIPDPGAPTVSGYGGFGEFKEAKLEKLEDSLNKLKPNLPKNIPDNNDDMNMRVEIPAIRGVCDDFIFEWHINDDTPTNEFIRTFRSWIYLLSRCFIIWIFSVSMIKFFKKG